jgi:uncharacterized alpha-E superfamily protein
MQLPIPATDNPSDLLTPRHSLQLLRSRNSSQPARPLMRKQFKVRLRRVQSRRVIKRASLDHNSITKSLASTVERATTVAAEVRGDLLAGIGGGGLLFLAGPGGLEVGAFDDDVG